MSDENFDAFGEYLMQQIMESLEENLEGIDTPQVALVIFDEEDPEDVTYLGSTENRAKAIKAMERAIFSLQAPASTAKH